MTSIVKKVLGIPFCRFHGCPVKTPVPVNHLQVNSTQPSASWAPYLVQAGQSYSLQCNGMVAAIPEEVLETIQMGAVFDAKKNVLTSISQKFSGCPGMGCFRQNFHKISQIFFLLARAECWGYNPEKIWFPWSTLKISSKSTQQKPRYSLF